jgi:hypothetical protein
MTLITQESLRHPNRITFTVGKESNAAAQSYRIRLQNDDGKRAGSEKGFRK